MICLIPFSTWIKYSEGGVHVPHSTAPPPPSEKSIYFLPYRPWMFPYLLSLNLGRTLTWYRLSNMKVYIAQGSGF